MRLLILFATMICLVAGCATSNAPSIQSAAYRDWKTPFVPVNPAAYDQRR